MRFPILILFAALLFSSCGNSGKIENLDWLVGHWEGKDVNDLTFHERWERSGKNSLAGFGATIKPDGDTLWKETLKIELVEGTPYYIANAPGNKGPVLFKMVRGDEHDAVFENKDHDFPQRISYTLETNNTMAVRLEGTEKGLPKIETLNFERMKDDSLITAPAPQLQIDQNPADTTN